MKLPEQLGYDPHNFSSAVQGTGDRETAERLRESSVASVDPFTPPEYFDLSPVARDERLSYDVEPEGEILDDDSEDNQVRTEEVGWIILPVDQGDERGPNSGESHRVGAPSEDDPANIKRLKAIARAWGNDSYIAVSRVEATDGTKYEVAVLPGHVQTKLGRIAIEHALADTPVDRNALLAWRAEKGINEDDEVVSTWREAFSGGKKHARTMGARRIYHTSTTDDRIEAYFSRPADEIDDRL
jgi:hypothetical protein